MDCTHIFLELCIIPALGQTEAHFFGFSEFIGAFALLAIVFMIVDVQYHFRISVSPIPLPKYTFWAICFIGFGTLLVDLWVAEGWLVIYIPIMTYGVLQACFATGFLITALAWLYFAFLKPPVFSKWNAKHYGKSLFAYLLRGSDSELPVIATEVSRSAEQIIKIFADNRAKFSEQVQKQKNGKPVSINPGNFAADILAMIGNRKFCRHVVSASPSTAIRIFQAVVDQEAYDAPIEQFSKNVSREAIKNLDSNLYHEDNRYQSGLFGDLKPFTRSIFGSYRLVEELGKRFGSPLDMDFEFVREWKAPHLKAYARAVLTTFTDRLNNGLWHEHSVSLSQAMNNFKIASCDIQRLNGVENGEPDIIERLSISVQFISDLLLLIERYEEKITVVRLKPNKAHLQPDIYDGVAELMLEIIYNAAGITDSSFQCWHIQHNLVWRTFFDQHNESRARKTIGFKLRRLIYQEIVELDRYADFKSFKAARYLGICLNCMGIKIPKKERRMHSTIGLQKVVLGWVRKNYPSLVKCHPTVAAACLMGGISYDDKKNQLVNTFAKPADREPHRDFFELK